MKKHLKMEKEKQIEIIDYHGAKIKCDLETRYSLFTLKNKEKVNFKCINGYYSFTSLQIAEIYDRIEKQIQSYFDIEMKIYEQIDMCQSISDFFNVKYDF